MGDMLISAMLHAITTSVLFVIPFLVCFGVVYGGLSLLGLPNDTAIMVTVPVSFVALVVNFIRYTRK